MSSVLCRYLSICTKYTRTTCSCRRRNIILASFIHTRFKHTVNPWSGDNSGAGEVQVAVGDE